MKLSLAVTVTLTKGVDRAMRLWRESNLIRHHLVAIPLLNYTDFEGNLAAPTSTIRVAIDEWKVANSPRFVHFDECLGFVDSGCARRLKDDSITAAKALYLRFHGAAFVGVTRELIQGKEVK